MLGKAFKVYIPLQTMKKMNFLSLIVILPSLCLLTEQELPDCLIELNNFFRQLLR